MLHDAGLAVELVAEGLESPTIQYFSISLKKTEVRNRVYKYDWSEDVIANVMLILDHPGKPGPYHNVGVVGYD